MKHILLLGATGFIGGNILPFLRERYEVTFPTRIELNSLDMGSVKRFLSHKTFDAVINLATPTGHNPVDKPQELFRSSLYTFISLADCGDLYGKMIYMGSGAEYGKHRDIKLAREKEFGLEIPRDDYGFSRYVMSKLAESAYNNVINLRLFGCYGPEDQPHKLVPSIIRCIQETDTITLKQECWFDFLYVTDIAYVLEYFIEHNGKHRVYNLCSGERVLISSIAREVCKQMGVNEKIIFQNDGFNLEYTGSNERLRSEMPGWNPTPMHDAIKNILKDGIL